MFDVLLFLDGATEPTFLLWHDAWASNAIEWLLENWLTVLSENIGKTCRFLVQEISNEKPLFEMEIKDHNGYLDMLLEKNEKNGEI